MLLTTASRAAIVACAAFSFAAPAYAQTATAPAPAADQTAQEGVGEIVVTAERRSENLQRVPVSVGVVDGADLRTFTSGGDDTLLSLSGRVPSLYIESTTGRIFPRFYIRGLGNIDFYLGASQPVSIIQDDIVLEHVVLKSNPVYDVRQVEVLRGPQGSLFGRNTTAGIVKFDTIAPSDTFQSRATASYGDYNSTNVDLGVGGPLADGVSFRASALVQHRENWVANTYTGVSFDGTSIPREKAMGGFDDRNVRLQLRLKPSSDVTIDLSGHARWYEGTSTLFHRAALKKGSNSVAAEPRDRVAYDEANDNPQAYNTYGGSLRASWDFGGAVLSSITGYETTSGYSRGDTDGGAAANFPVNGVANGYGQSQGQIRDLDQWTQELRLASDGSGPFRWQLGGYYFDSRDTTDFYQRAFFLTTAANNPNNWVRLRNVNTSWAVFGQASYDVTPDFTLTVGARETNDTKTTRLLKTADTVAGVSTYTGRRVVRLSDTTPSWDVSALYRVSDDLSLYARVARGFRGPTIQGRSAVFNADFTTADSETITSYEAGFKSVLFGNTLRLNASGFTYVVNDIQLNGNDSNGNGVLFNAAKARAYGVEADAQWRPVPNLTFGLGASWLHSRIRDTRVYAQVCALNGVVVCTVENPTIRIGNNIFAQIDGEPLPNAPEYNLNLTARYDQPVGEGRVFVSTDWNVQGYTQFTLYRTKEFTSNGNFEGGLQIGYAAPGDAWELSAFARNITNEKNLKGVIENYMAAVFNEPRVIGVQLSGKFR
ncbi:TonB-dependent receptor [uncultured Sphingomonas sp.]|uniref:TonB-dependent receptor n=1 Tax=uncultured Sphingomonas sp. TaxID=158754 RepID=UPI0037489BFB